MSSTDQPASVRLGHILGVLPELPPNSPSLAVDFATGCVERRLSDRSPAQRREIRELVVQYLGTGDGDPTLREQVDQMYARLALPRLHDGEKQRVKEALGRSPLLYVRLSPKLDDLNRPLRWFEHDVLAAVCDETLGSVGHAPSEGDPVPGCSCVSCLSLAAGGLPSEARSAREVLKHLALLPPSKREEHVRMVNAESQRLGHVPRLLSPKLLAQKAAALPNAVTEESEETPIRRDLPVSARQVRRARRVRITVVAERLGLGTPQARGSEYAALCPFHDDTSPSLRLNDEENIYYCFVCGEGGDSVELVQRVLGAEFLESVRWLTEGRVA